MAKAKYKQGKDGWFSTLAWDGTYNADGSKHRKQLRTKKSSKELERMVTELRNKVDNRQITVGTDMTFCEYAKHWLEVYKAQKELNTRKMYENIITVHFRQLTGIKLTDIRRIHLQAVLNSVTPSTGRQVYLCFKQIIKSAVVDKYLTPAYLEDIFAGIQQPKPPKTEKRVLTRAEKEAIPVVDLDPMDKAFLYIIYGCGLRREEALALTVFDIDLRRAILSVNKALVFDGNNPCLKGTKSENGVRSVPMPGFLTDYLKQYIKTLNGTNLFFCRGRDHVTHSSYVKMWNRIRKAIGQASGSNVTDLTAHVFRHNFCTNLCYQIPKISIKHIAQLMGDAEKVVLDIYNHIILDKEDAAGAVENAVGIF